MHDGCNARAWVQLQVSRDVTRVAPADPPPIAAGTHLCTGLVGQAPVITDAALLEKADQVFETMADVDALRVAHNAIPFYTWGDQECCLPVGTTSATLGGHLPNLQAGDVVVLEEVLGPLTGDAVDAEEGLEKEFRDRGAAAIVRMLLAAGARNVIVCDLDGTISHQRTHFVQHLGRRLKSPVGRTHNTQFRLDTGC